MAHWVQSGLLQVMVVTPEALLWPFARRYVAGSTLADTLPILHQLKQQGLLTTVDVLGESETQLDAIQAAQNQYTQVLQHLHAHTLDGNISLKLSQFGLLADADYCVKTVESLVRLAAENGQFVRLDMEDSTCTDATLTIYRRLRQRYPNVGIVLQARLYRTPDDLAQLMAEGIAHVRLCKGIYREPAHCAHTSPHTITQAFIALMDTMLTAPTVEKLAIASHDPVIIHTALERINSRPAGSPVEFQMLLGVGEGLRQHIAHSNVAPVRVYVPFGHHWKTYCLRRFRENPALLGHVLKQLYPFA